MVPSRRSFWSSCKIQLQKSLQASQAPLRSSDLGYTLPGRLKHYIWRGHNDKKFRQWILEQSCTQKSRYWYKTWDFRGARASLMIMLNCLTAACVSKARCNKGCIGARRCVSTARFSSRYGAIDSNVDLDHLQICSCSCWRGSTIFRPGFNKVGHFFFAARALVFWYPYRETHWSNACRCRRKTDRKNVSGVGAGCNDRFSITWSDQFIKSGKRWRWLAGLAVLLRI